MDGEFTFGDVEPTAMLGRGVPLDSGGNASCLCRLEASVERGRRVHVEVVGHVHDPLGIGLRLFSQDARFFGRIHRRAPFCNVNRALATEWQGRDRRGIESRLRLARFPWLKTLDQFEFDFQPSLDRRQVRELAGLSFVERAHNVVVLGPPGVGKTHLAVALGVLAVEAGYSVQFLTLETLMTRLVRAKHENRLERALQQLTYPKLLILDEIGYLPLSREEASLFFRLVVRRYERASLIVTSNKSFLDWGEVFNDHVLAAAILDRLLHHSTTLNIKGESFRLKEKRRAGPLGRPKPLPDEEREVPADV